MQGKPLTIKQPKSAKKSCKNPQTDVNNEHLPNKSEQIIEKQQQTSVPSHLQLKYLLNQFIKHCSHNKSQDKPNTFTNYDAQRVAFLLSPQGNIGIDEILDQFVLERLILTMQVIDQWGAAGFQALAIFLKQKYHEFSQTILSPQFHQQGALQPRRKKAMERVQQYCSKIAMQ